MGCIIAADNSFFRPRPKIERGNFRFLVFWLGAVLLLTKQVKRKTGMRRNWCQNVTYSGGIVRIYKGDHEEKIGQVI